MALVALALLLLPAASAAAVTARPADSFVDSIGVNVHLGFTDTPYFEEYDGVAAALEQLGVRHVRDVLYRDSSEDQYEAIDDLASRGIGSTLVLGSPADGASGLEELITSLKSKLAGAVDAVEGPNEYSTTSGDAEWVNHLTAYQQQLDAEINADPALEDLPVIGPSIVHGDQDELGNVSSYLDYGNIHSYPQGNPPDKLGSFITRAELNSGTKPIAATETGYHTALNWSGEQPPVSEAAMATYVPRLFLEYFRWGIVRTFSYELLDEFPNPALDQREDHFGLLRNDLAPKPAFTALANTIAILEDPGPAFVPGSLDYTLSENGVDFPGPESTGLHRVLMNKRDGSFYLALWRTTSVWDPAKQESIAAPAEPVTVTVKPGIESAVEYLPNDSSAPVWSLTKPADPVSVEVGPRVVILKLMLAAEGLPSPPTEPSTSGNDTSTDIELPEQVPPPRRCHVPALRDRTLSSARKRLASAGCALGAVTRVGDSAHRPPRVIRQAPRPGARRAPGALVRLTLR